MAILWAIWTKWNVSNWLISSSDNFWLVKSLPLFYSCILYFLDALLILSCSITSIMSWNHLASRIASCLADGLPRSLLKFNYGKSQDLFESIQLGKLFLFESPSVFILGLTRRSSRSERDFKSLLLLASLVLLAYRESPRAEIKEHYSSFVRCSLSLFLGLWFWGDFCFWTLWFP